MPDYSKGKIYTIKNKNDETKIYVGSTVQTLAKRFRGHQSDSKMERYKNSLFYRVVNNDWTDWYIELYEEHPCNSEKDLKKKEGDVIRLIGTLNKCIAGRIQKEYQIENADKIKEYQKEYREKHKGEIKEQRKEYLNNIVLIMLR
jgi:hypothetical protein